MATLSRPPVVPSLLAGFLNLAGIAVPVLRLDRLFGLPDLALGRYTPLVLLRQRECPLALLVERVSRIVAVPEEAILPVPANQAFNDCVEGSLPSTITSCSCCPRSASCLKRNSSAWPSFRIGNRTARALEGPGL